MNIPTEINLHQKSKLLRIKFDDDHAFDLPCEYLRVYSPAIDQKAALIIGKETVNITAIEPQGNYGIRIIFDDGHDTAIYSWETLFDLGNHYPEKWQEYSDLQAQSGYERKQTEYQRTLTLHYFVYFVKQFKKETEIIEAPEDVKDVRSLLAHLRKRGAVWAKELQDDNVTITVNKQFAELFTTLDNHDEVGIVPKYPAQKIS